MFQNIQHVQWKWTFSEKNPLLYSQREQIILFENCDLETNLVFDNLDPDDLLCR